MKKKNISILFTDNSVTSKNFACHFLHYDIFCLDDFQLTVDNNNFNVSQLKLNQKHLPELDFIICLQKLQPKLIDNLASLLTTKTVILTNNISNFVIFQHKRINCCYIKFNCDMQQQQEKLTLKSSENLENLSESISIKHDNQLISKVLSKHIINASVGAVCLLQNKKPKQLCFSFKAKKIITNLIKEQIFLTNNVMLTVEKYKKLNFYKFLSGKGLWHKIRQNFSLFIFLHSLSVSFNQESILNSLNEINELSFNNQTQIPKTQSLIQNFQQLLQKS